MSRRDDATSLRQMLDHAREIVDLTRGRSLADAEADRVLELAVLWREVTPTWNWLIHVYDDVDFTRIWRTATEDVPQLVDQLERILR